jgi:hypothetical protein
MKEIVKFHELLKPIVPVLRIEIAGIRADIGENIFLEIQVLFRIFSYFLKLLNYFKQKLQKGPEFPEK